MGLPAEKLPEMWNSVHSIEIHYINSITVRHLHNNLWTFALTIVWGYEAAVHQLGFGFANKRRTAVVNENNF